VTVGGASATGVAFVDSTTLLATTPAGTAGARDVVVTNPDAQADTLTGGFTYIADPVDPPSEPTVVSLLPVTGTREGGTEVTITGTNFEAGATVLFGALEAANVSVDSATTITCDTPPGPVGDVNVTVTNTDTGTATLIDGFEYLAIPRIDTVNPATGPLSGGTTITITGVDFITGCTVTVGGLSATVVSVSSTQVVVTAPAGAAGSASIVVTNPTGEFDTEQSAFTYIAETNGHVFLELDEVGGVTVVLSEV
jgi:hypothetical protein